MILKDEWIVKKILFVLVIIWINGFIINSCNGDDECILNNCQSCKNGQHHEIHCVNINCPEHDCKNHNKIACNVCNLKCECPERTIHFIGDTMQCINENNCNCEHGEFEGQRVNGITITNRENVTNFNAMVTLFNETLDFFFIYTKNICHRTY